MIASEDHGHLHMVMRFLRCFIVDCRNISWSASVEMRVKVRRTRTGSNRGSDNMWFMWFVVVEEDRAALTTAPGDQRRLTYYEGIT
jgi:hypothetical protein